MPLYPYVCKSCGERTDDYLRRSYDDAIAKPALCLLCGVRMEVAITTFAFTQFRSFTTDAFNKRPGQKPIEVSDRAQLRSLLRSNRMCEMGDAAHGYFGSNPKSVPTWEEISKHGKSGGDPKLAKLVKTAPAKEFTEKLEKAAEQTNFGRKQELINPEFVVR